MLLISKYKAYFETLKTRMTDIKSFVLVSEFEELEDYIKNLKKSDFPILVVREPSGDSMGNEDNQRWKWPCLLYVLEKFDHTSETYMGRWTAKANLLRIIGLVNDKMLEDMHNHTPDGDKLHLMHNLQPDGMHIDPENNFLGCLGYSLSFNLLTL